MCPAALQAGPLPSTQAAKVSHPTLLDRIVHRQPGTALMQKDLSIASLMEHKFLAGIELI